MKRSKKYTRRTRKIQLIAIASLAIITATLATLKLMGLFTPIKINTSDGISGLIAGETTTTNGVSVASDGAIVCNSIVEGVKNSDLSDGTYTFRVTGNNGTASETKDYKVELINYADDVTYTANTSLGDTSTEYKMLVVKYHKNLTINSGVTITANTVNSLTYKKGMYICVMGKLTNNGTISMTARGTYNCVGENVYLWKNADGSYEYIPAVGGSGVVANTNGIDGENRQTGGGAGGCVESAYGGSGGNGAAGTSYSGGAAGGGTTRNYAGPGSANGGSGGYGSSWGGLPAGGGAGNPGGSGNYSGNTGTGGLLIIYANDMLNNSIISAEGTKGGGGYTPGGGSGGGSINIFYNTIKNVGSIEANGGEKATGPYSGGYSEAGHTGGKGAVTFNQVEQNLNCNIKSLQLKVGEMYLIDTSKINLQNGLVTGNVLGKISYESLDNKIATIDKNGNILAIAEGKTKIKITDTTNNISTYVYIETIDGTKIDVEEGRNFTVALKKNGTVWSYGLNKNGQLGIGNDQNITTPIQVLFNNGTDKISKIKAIATGYSHTLALDENGEVYSWGLGTNGQLGDGNSKDSNIPVKVDGLTKIVKIDAYKNMSIALDSDGKAYVWGENYSNLPSKLIISNKIIDISGEMILTESGNVYKISNINVSISGLSNITKISCGLTHYLAIDAEGIAYAGGSNTYGECKSNVDEKAHYIAEGITDISAGNYTSILLSNDGKTYILGNNSNGEIGLSTTSNTSTLTEVTLSDNSKVEGISAGEGTHCSLIDTNGFVWSTGLNTYGELGLGNTTACKVFTKTGDTIVTTDIADKIYLDINETKTIKSILENTFNLKIDTIDDKQEDFEIAIENTNIATATDKDIKANTYGTTKITIKHTSTGKTKEVTLVVIMKMESIVQGFRDADLSDGEYTVLVNGQIYNIELINYLDNMEYSKDTSLGDSTTDYKTLVVKYHKNLTIDKGITLTATSVNNLTYKKGMYLCVLGNIYNNGTISMTARGTYNYAGEDVYLWKNTDSTYEYVPSKGGKEVDNGNAGTNGNGRQTGGGAGGIVETVFGGRGGSGSAGTAYSGGSGGGSTTRATAGNAEINGGAGGAGGAWNSYSAGGGAGNPGGSGATGGASGENGTGGLLIMYTNLLYNSGNISSKGSNGGFGYTVGGSSGGGSINIFANKVMSNTETTAVGGKTPNSNYGAGGNGTVTINELGSVLNYAKKSIKMKTAETYSVDTSKITYTKLNTIQTEDLKLGTISYESADNTIATVDSTGKISAVANGKTKIKITDTTNGYETYIFVTVSDHQEAEIESANNFTLTLKENGTVWGFGLNDKGQLGNGTTTNSNEASEVKLSSTKDALEDIVDICAKDSTSIAVSQSGDVYTWGIVQSLEEVTETASNNETNTVSTTTTNKLIENDLTYATKVEGLSNIQKVSIYNGNYYAIDNNGKLFVWGKNYTKITSLDSEIAFADISGDIVLGENGLVYKLSNLSTAIMYINNIVKISSGVDHYLFLDTEGNVHTLGKNSKGQLGNNQISTSSVAYPILVQTNAGYLSNIYNISAGNMSSMASSMDGKLYSWGDNTNSKIGLTDATYLVATEVTKGINLKNESITLSNIEIVSTGETSSAIADKDGFVYTIGLNKYGELGTKDETSRTSLTKIGETEISTVPDQLELLAGNSEDISVYLSNTFNLKTDIADVSNITTKMINKNIATITSKSGIDNSNKTDKSQLTPNYTLTGKKVGKTILVITNTKTGDKKNIIIKVKSEKGKVAPKIEAGNNFTISLKADGTVWSWGNNDYGQLGIGSSEKTNIPTASILPTENNSSISKIITDISVGYNHALMLSDDGEVYAFGYNGNGQLGIGNTQNKKSAIPVLKTDGTVLTGINKIVANKNTSFAIDLNGNVYAWGDGYGKTAQLINLKDASGNSVTDDVVDISKTYYLNEDGIVKKLADCSVISTQESIMQISEGEDHTIFLGESQKAYSIGSNVYGQLGDGTTLGKTEQVTTVLTAENTSLNGIQTIKAGNKYSIAVTTDGKVYGFGINGNGEIGQEITTQESHYAILKSDLINAIDADTGLTHNAVIKSDGNVYSWGLGSDGQLGNGENFDYIKAQLVGKNLVETNTNRILLQVGETYNLTSKIQYFNIFKDISSNIEYDSQDSSKAICGTLTGEVMAVDEGTTTIIAKDKITGNIAIVQVRILATGTKPDSMTTLVEPQVSTAGSHTAMLKVDGTVWTFGQNDYGQLGNGTTVASDEPVEVSFPTGTIITQVEAGDEYCIALDKEGNVWTWGKNNYYQLGVSNVSYSLTPIKLTDLPKAKKVAAGSNMSMILTEAKEVYSFGLNADGEGGTGTYTNKVLPTKAKYLTDIMDISVARSHAIALKTTGDVYSTGSNIYGQLGTSRNTTRRNNMFTKVEGIKKIASINASDSSNVVANTDGQVYTWGSNIYGQLGTNDKTNKDVPTLITNVSGIVSVSAGKENTILIDNQNNIYSVGENSEGQIGDNTTTAQSTYIKISSISDIINASSGDTYTVALKKDGTVWAWGDYNHGDKLLKSKTNSEIPVLVGNDTTGFEQNVITLKVGANIDIGANTVYQFNLININKNFNENLTYETLNEKIATIDATGKITGVANGTTWVRATDKSGKKYVIMIKVIGTDNSVAPEVKSGSNFASVLKADGSIWSFGYNSNGELADATNIAKDIPTRTNVIATYKELVAGKSFIVALRADNTVWASGENTYGQLGTGDTKNQNKLLQINGLTSIQKIAAGDDYAVALDNYGILYGWGKNTSGQIGASNIGSNTIKPTKIEGITSRIIDIAAGKAQTVVITAKGTIFGLGKILTGELSSITNAVKVAVGNGYILILTADGNVYKYQSGKATQISTIANAIDISVENDVNMYQDKDGNIYNWGSNSNGQLANNTKTDITDPYKVYENAFTMGASYNNTYVIKTTGEVYSSGKNTYGALGDSVRDDSQEYVLVGDRKFDIAPTSKIMTVNDVENVTINSNSFNAFNSTSKDLTQYTWTSNNTDTATAIEGVITAKAEGEATITATDKITGVAKTALRVVVPTDKQRIKSIKVNDTEAEVSGEMKYAVKIITDDKTGTIKVSTNDSTDQISIDNGATWQDKGTLTSTVTLENKKTEIPVIVKTSNGTQLTYTLTVEKVSKDIGIKSLTVAGKEATAVSTERYEISVDDATSYEIKGITNNNLATIGIDGLKAETNVQAQTIAMEDKTIKEIPIIVTSESGNQQEYTLIIYKKSEVLNLAKVTVNGAEATKISENKYSINVDKAITSAEIIATAESSLANVNIAEGDYSNKEAKATITISEDNSTVNIKAQSGDLTKEYTLEIHRKDSTDKLSMVIVNGNTVNKNSAGQYEIYLPNAEDTAVVRAIASSINYYVKIDTNDKEKAESERTVNTPEVSNSYTITLTDENNVDTTYTLLIKKAEADTSLNSIIAKNGTDTFSAKQTNAKTLEYEVRVPNTYTSVNVEAVTGYANSKVQIEDNTSKVHIDSKDIVLSTTSNTTDIKIVVTSENAKETSEYTLHITKMSSDTTLKEVKVGKITATLQSDGSYTAQLTDALTDATILATTNDANANVKIGTSDYSKQTISSSIIIDGKNVNTVIYVNAEDGTIKQYPLKITGLPDDTNLTYVKVNGQEAIYNSEDDMYEIRLDDTSYNITAELEDSLAKVQLTNGTISSDYTEGKATLTVEKKGTETIVYINTKAQNGVDTQTYKLAIEEKSNNTNIDTVIVNGITATVDKDGNYTASVNHLTTNLNISATAEDTKATMMINSTTQNKQNATLTDTITAETMSYTLTVTSEKETISTRTLTVKRLEGNINLSKVNVGIAKDTLSNVTLKDDGTYYYKTTRADSIYVNGIAESSNSSVKIGENAKETQTSTKEIKLDKEITTTIITVIGQDGTTKDYTLNIEKQSNDNTIKSITSTSKIDVEKTTSGDSYIIYCDESVTSLPLTILANSSLATTKLSSSSDYGTTSVSTTIDLSTETTGNTSVDIKAEDGEVKTYPIVINKKTDLSIQSVKVNSTEIPYENEQYSAVISVATTTPVVITTTNSAQTITLLNGTTTIATGTGTLSTNVSLTAQTTTLTVRVTSHTGMGSQDSTLVIRKKSQDNSISYIKVDGYGVTKLTDTTFKTTVSGKNVYPIEIKTKDEYAKVKVDSGAYAKQLLTDTISVADGETKTFTITVQSENGEEKTYSLTIERVSSSTDIESITVQNLKAGATDGSKETVNVTNYNENTKTYTIIVDKTLTTSDVVITAKAAFTKLTLDKKVSQTKTATLTKELSGLGTSTVTIDITAADGTTETRYLNIVQLSDEINLSYVKVNGVEATKDDIGNYTITELETEANATIEAKSVSETATVQVKDAVATKSINTATVPISGQRTVEVPIIVTAENGTSYTYKLKINIISNNTEVEYVKSNDVKSDAKDTTYTVFVNASDTTGVAEIKTISQYAKIKIGDITGSNIEKISQEMTQDSITKTFQVIAENGDTKDYTINFVKKSQDNSLKELYVDGTLITEIADGKYVANVVESKTSSTIKAITTNEYANVKINTSDVAIHEQTTSINLNTKTQEVSIIITSQNGESATYTLTVNHVSEDNTLSYVKVNGTSASKVTTDENNVDIYKIFIPEDVTESSIDIKATNEYATIKETADIVDGENSSINELKLEKVATTEKVTTITFEITSESKVTKKYELQIAQASNDNSIKELYVDGTLISLNSEGKYSTKVLDTDTSPEVKVIANNEYATVRIALNSENLATATNNVQLSSSKTTTVPITIRSQSGITKVVNLYIEKIATSTKLESVVVDGQEVTTYNSQTKTYSTIIESTKTSAEIFAMAESNYATVELESESALASITKTVDIPEGTDGITLTIKVIAENNNSEEYKLQLIRKSTDTTVKLVEINDKNVTPSEDGVYTMIIPKLATTAKIRFATTNVYNGIRVGDQEKGQGETAVTLSNLSLTEEKITVPVIVTAADGTTTKTYNIILIRGDNTAEISELTIDGEVITPKSNLYEKDTLGVEKVKVKITAKNAKTKIEFNGQSGVGTLETEVALSDVQTIKVAKLTSEDETVSAESTVQINKLTGIIGNIKTENISSKYNATIKAYLTSDTRIIGDATNPREEKGTVTIDETGAYKIRLDAAGTYDIVITKPGYLDYVETNIVVTNGNYIIIDTINLIAGDVIKTGEIEIDDLIALTDNYCELTDANKANKTVYDLNEDGIINNLDREILKKNYGRRFTQVTWKDPKEETKKVEKTNFVLPMSSTYAITSGYGYRIHPISGRLIFHSGVDISGTWHTEIYATADGTVTYAGVQSGYGNCIEIKHTIEGKTMYTFYAHLSEIDVKVGDTVKQSTKIGLEGGATTDPNHGTSTGHHLHFEMRDENRNTVDPNNYINL